MDGSIQQDWVDAEYTEICTQLVVLEANDAARLCVNELERGDRAMLIDELADEHADELLMRLRAIEASADAVRELFVEQDQAWLVEARAHAIVETYLSWSRRLAVWASRALSVAFAVIVLLGLGPWAESVFVLALLGCGAVGIVRSRRADRLLDQLSKAVEDHTIRRAITDEAITALRDGTPIRRVQSAGTVVAATPDRDA